MLKKEGSTASRVLPVAGCPFIGATWWPRRLAVSWLIYSFRWAGSRPAASLVVSIVGSGAAGSPLHRPAARNGISMRAQLLPPGVAASGVRFYVFEIRRRLQIRACPSWTHPT